MSSRRTGECGETLSATCRKAAAIGGIGELEVSTSVTRGTAQFDLMCMSVLADPFDVAGSR